MIIFTYLPERHIYQNSFFVYMAIFAFLGIRTDNNSANFCMLQRF